MRQYRVIAPNGTVQEYFTAEVAFGTAGFSDMIVEIFNGQKTGRAWWYSYCWLFV